MGHRPVTALIVAAAACLVGCGPGESASTGVGSVPVPCSVAGSVPCGQPSSTAAPLPVCGVVTADLVTAALGETATFLGTDASGCGFSAGQWSLGVNAVAYDPGTQGAAVTGPTLAGAAAPHSAFLNNDRSGLWQVRGSLVADEVLYSFFLRNNATGSDTYPGFDGPEQRPPTAAAAVALVNAIARAG
jgi:hypothetical protein